MSEGYWSDNDYFASYADPGVHRLMIQDHARTDAYRRAIEAVAKGKRVLDIGTGTGILSMFAARAGAAKVDAVDSSGIIDVARELAADNGLSDKITFHRGRAEDLDLDSEYDLVISEWMGFFGLAELMFESVIHARDRFLTPGGHMLPGHLRLKVAPVDDSHVHEDLGIGLWERPVYGLDFTRLLEAEVPSSSSPLWRRCRSSRKARCMDSEAGSRSTLPAASNFRARPCTCKPTGASRSSPCGPSPWSAGTRSAWSWTPSAPRTGISGSRSTSSMVKYCATTS